jgi:hypothetical protein
MGIKHAEFRGANMRRREFIGLIGGAAALPFMANAQQAERTRRIGLLMPYPNKDNPEAQARIAAFLQEAANGLDHRPQFTC